jgi:AraC-like DNA-binding protein
MTSPGTPLPDDVPTHLLRPGVVLTWGEPAQLGPWPPPAIALFWFTLAGDGAMACTASHAAGEAIAATKGGFMTAISLDRLALQELLAGDESEGAARLRALAESPGATAPLTLPLSAGARLAVESIRRCPFVGACRGMALTARGNDLLVEFLTALANARDQRLPPLTRAVAAQIHAAAHLLQVNLEQAPTLADLARGAGLSESTLKRGFHQVFGTTVFGYLRARRMERARTLLESGEATVLEAAALVGYSNPSNFAAAFRQQFGVNPKAFQLNARRQ